MQRPRISVVVPTHQRRADVVALVEGLARQSAAPSFETIVVVDGSTDGTAAALRALAPPFPLAVVEQDTRGAAAARNAGAAGARGELLLFLDDDMEPDLDLLAAHDRRHRQGADAVVGHMPVHPQSKPEFLAVATGHWVRHRLESLRNAETVPADLVLTGQLSVARRWYERIGGFDERFTHAGAYGGEDTDFGLRLARAGACIVFEPGAVSRQRLRIEPRAYLRRYRDVGRAYVRLLRQHPDLPEHVIRVDLKPGRFDRWVGPWVYPWVEPLVAAALAAGLRHPRLERLFFGRLRSRHYWRGVRESGGYPEPRPVRVLAYHAVADLDRRSPLGRFAVSADQLRRQLGLLRRCGFRFLEPGELERMLHDGHGVPRRALLVTFDDAYADLAHEALSVLRQAEVPAAAFVVTGQIGGDNEWDARHGLPRRALCTSDELRILVSNGVALGSHSRTHAALDELDEPQLAAELEGSAADLEAVGFARPRWLAYPYGRSNGRVRAAAAAVGYRLAFGIAGGVVTAASDPYELPRIEITRRDRGLRLLVKVLAAGLRRPARARRAANLPPRS